MENKIPPSAELREKIFDARMRRMFEKIKLESELPEEGDYKTAYLILYNGITSAMEHMAEWNYGRARSELKYAQIDAEAALRGEDEDEGDEDGEEHRNTSP